MRAYFEVPPAESRGMMARMSHPKPRVSLLSRLSRSVAGLLGRKKKSSREAEPARKKNRSRKRRPSTRPAPASKPTAHGTSAVAPTKAETSRLPRFEGLSLARIHVPRTKAECEAAAEAILAAGVAGFDTEAKPIFNAGETSGGPHVVQFALTDRAFIFQLHRRECVETTAALIASDRVLKVGFGLKNDHGQIRRRLGVRLEHVLDLDHVFRRRGYRGQIGVRAAMGAVLGLNFPKSKRTTTSNWAAKTLTPSQLIYAANDAHAALKIMEALDLPAEEMPAPRGR